MKTVILVLASFFAITAAKAQWTTQSIVLTPGWNAVYLEVQPEPREADTVFSGLPIASAWEWTRVGVGPQFVNDVFQPVPQSAEWATWFPVGDPQRAATNLFQIRGGRPLIIKLNGNSNITWNVTGIPAQPLNEWLPTGSSLMGFHVESPGAPTFKTFFANSAAHVGNPASSTRPIVRTLSASGTWTVIANTSTIQRHKSYWVETLSASTFTGPLTVEMPSATGMHYGLAGNELELVFHNSNTTGNRTVNLRLISSLARPATAADQALVAGDVRLSFKDQDAFTQTTPQFRYLPLDGAISLTVEPGTRSLFLAVRRQDFLPPLVNTGTEALYQSMLEVREGGSRLLVPITALKTIPAADNPQMGGLWEGRVSVTGVSWAGGVSPQVQEANPAFDGINRTTSRPVKSDFSFRVLLHMDATGDVRLLQKVQEVWQNGTYQPDPANPGLLLPATSGQYRLFTDDAAASAYVGTGLRDGTLSARRISTPIFGMHQPQVMALSGAFGADGSQVSCTVVTPYDDPLNPFKHSFHPQHDNYNASYSAKLPVGVESWTIERELSLKFTSAHPYNTASPRYGDTELGGDYKETIRGVHRYDLHVGGKFLIHKISTTTKLN